MKIECIGCDESLCDNQTGICSECSEGFTANDVGFCKKDAEIANV